MKGSARTWGVVGALGLIAGVAWIYREVTGFDFVLFDDEINVALNPGLGGWSWERWGWAWTDLATMRRYVPLGWLGWLAIYQGAGLEPAAYHLANLGAHAVNTLLVFWITRRVLRLLRPPRGGSDAAADSDRREVVVAAIATAAWAWHPLQVELVAWVSGWLYLQAAGWALVAGWAWLRAEEAELAGRPRAGWWRVTSVAAYAGSLLAYPMALAFPVVVGVWEWGRGRREPGAWWGRVAPVGAVAAVAVAVNVVARLEATGIWVPGLPWAENFAPARLLAAVYSYSHYAGRVVAPTGLTPVVDALYAPSWADGRLWAGAGGVVLAVAGVWWWGRTWPAVRLVVLVGVLGLVPHWGWFEPVPFPCDRYLYLLGAWLVPAGAAGLALVLARVGWRYAVTSAPGMGEKRRIERGRVHLWARLGLVAAAGGLGLLAVGARQQTEVWRDTTALYDHIVAGLRQPEVQGFYAARAATVHTLLGRESEAAAWAARARAAAPGSAEVDTELARRTPLRAATAAGMTPLAQAHHRLAVQAGRKGDAVAMEAQLRRAVHLAPAGVRARQELALLLAFTGRAEEARRQWAALPPGATTAAEEERFAAALRGEMRPASP